ncbi:MAG: hypothetical protein E7426_03925 [Ruminococcaceae bacterium]|jgi:hypothetical protein|nr:hypothetical protein [Oscillospiraceae bacterium]
MNERKTSPAYRVLEWLVRTFYPAIETVGAENLPNEPVVIVGNHSQLHGPIACQLYFPGKPFIWCAGEMMELREVPGYAYRDFWSQKPRRSRWFYKLMSYLIAPLAVCLFNNARTIAVRRDSQVLSTFRESVKRLQSGSSLVIFPEYDKKYNHILYDFQENFVDVARLYHKKTGTELSFVPLYIAPKLRKMYVGRPIRFCAANPIEEERRRICDVLMREITDLAGSLPRHTVIPYRNIPKRLYPSNISDEVQAHEKTGR